MTANLIKKNNKMEKMAEKIVDKENLAVIFQKAQVFADNRGKRKDIDGATIEMLLQKDELEICSGIRFYQAGYVQTIVIKEAGKCVFSGYYQSYTVGDLPNAKELLVGTYKSGNWENQIQDLRKK